MIDDEELLNAVVQQSSQLLSEDNYYLDQVGHDLICCCFCVIESIFKVFQSYLLRDGQNIKHYIFPKTCHT